MLLVCAIVATPQTATQASAKKCEVCSTDYTPICAAPTGSKEEKDKISFGSVCVMRKYNCESNKSKLNADKFHLFKFVINPSPLHADFVKMADGECPGKRPVRLQ